MAAQHTLHAGIAKPLVSDVGERVTQRYTTASETVGQALRLLVEKGAPLSPAKLWMSLSAHV